MTLNNSNKPKLKRNQKAVTLTELLITVSIFVFAFALIYTTFATGQMSWKTYQSRVIVQREARLAMTTMTIELRKASAVTITQDSNNALISFILNDLGTVSYAWTNTGQQARRIIRTQDTNQRIIASNVSALSFLSTSKSVTINLTVTNQQATGPETNFSLKEKVALRLELQ